MSRRHTLGAVRAGTLKGANPAPRGRRRPFRVPCQAAPRPPQRTARPAGERPSRAPSCAGLPISCSSARTSAVACPSGPPQPHRPGGDTEPGPVRPAGREAARVQTAMGAEGRVAGSGKGVEDIELLRANSTGGDAAAPCPGQSESSHLSKTKGRRTSAMTPLTRSTLLAVLWLCCEPKMRDAPGVSRRLVQKALAKRVSRSETGTLGSLTSRTQRGAPRTRTRRQMANAGPMRAAASATTAFMVRIRQTWFSGGQCAPAWSQFGGMASKRAVGSSMKWRLMIVSARGLGVGRNSCWPARRPAGSLAARLRP